MVKEGNAFVEHKEVKKLFCHGIRKHARTHTHTHTQPNQHCQPKAELTRTSEGHLLPTKLSLLKQVKTLKHSFKTLKNGLLLLLWLKGKKRAIL